MAFDGFFTASIAHELKENLLLGKIDKIYQPDKQELVFRIHTKKGKKQVYASVNPERTGIYLSEDSYVNPTEPSGFCMLLRKMLQNGRIVNIQQVGFERIIEFSIETLDEMGFCVNRKLIFEIMGRHSNIVLVDMSTGKVTECIKRVPLDVSSIRPLYPGLKYYYPPAQNKVSPFEADETILNSANTSKELLGKVQGLSPILAEKVFDAIDRKSALKELLHAIDNPKPRVYFKENTAGKLVPADFHVAELDIFTTHEPKNFDSVSNAVEYFYKNRIASNRMTQKSQDLSKTLNSLIKKQNLKLQRLLEDIQKAENCQEHKLIGELITANMHQIKEGMSSITLLNYYDNSNVTLKLDKRLSPSQNAQKYYKSYNKAKRAIVEKTAQIEICKADIKYLESVESHLTNATADHDIDQIKLELATEGYIGTKRSAAKLKNNTKKSKPLEFFTSNGLRVLVGKNNKENDNLTFKTAGRQDIWLHTKDIPGSHVILFTDGKEPADADIFEAASIAAYHSKGKDSENVPVDYTLVKFVKKPNGAKPGMVIFTNNKTLYVTPKQDV